ncbi:MAG: hypothetical protein P4M11_12775 [Candidatus Pacebacteria bacterium]|nr:hypothetical protein [Candidatus Paceibacterota bacterium]
MVRCPASDNSDIIENSLLHTFEIMLNCVMVVDIVLRMLIIGYGRTGSKLSAILDVITLLVCVLAIGLSALCQGSVSRLEELGDKILIVVICAAQYLRILNFFKMHRQRMAEESHKINIRADAGPEHRSIIIVDNIKGIDGSPATAAHNNKV